MYFYSFAISPLWKGLGPSFENKLESSSPKDALCKLWFEKAEWFWRRIFSNVLNVFYYFQIISHLRMLWPFIWTNLNPFTQEVLFQVWLKLDQWFWRRRFLKVFNVFLLFHNYCPLRRAYPFIWTNLNPPHPRIVCAKFDLNWPSGSGEEDF